MSSARVVVLTRRSPAADLLVRELSRCGLQPVLVVLEESGFTRTYGSLSRWVRAWLGHRIVDGLAGLRHPIGTRRTMAWEQREIADAGHWMAQQAEMRGLGGDAYPGPVIETASVNSPATVQRIRLAQPDLMLVFGTRILRPTLIGVPKRGSINMHSSLLPHDRGSMPEFWQCMRGDLKHAGVTFHLITPEIDAGDILLQLPVAAQWPINSHRLRAINVLNAIEAFPKVAADLLSGAIAPVPQPPPPAGEVPHRVRDVTLRRRVQAWKLLRESE